MWDMKASFTITNPTVTGVEWSFVPEVSEETAAEEGQAPPGGPKEGEVTGGANIAENMVVLDELEAKGDQADAEAILPNQQ
ncbi:hypothetical protein TIFTF001_029914 [Ficus carica]|uniref:Uncharacterized protein n=1 Tax=Ficus carica TaxID=3494 RepID=A0AA88IYT0_FICCA|nr:hypothetical protein TIFTF001_029914 [Ficus carica]